VGLDLSREEREFTKIPKGLVLAVPFPEPRRPVRPRLHGEEDGRLEWLQTMADRNLSRRP